MPIDGSANSLNILLPALTDGILDMVGTESILVLFLGSNEGCKYWKIEIKFFIKGIIMQRIDMKILKMRNFGLG